MIVRMSRGQIDRISEVAGPLHLRWLDEAHKDTERMWDVTMPPIGWRTLIDRIMEAAFTPSGYRSGDKAHSLGSGLRRISKQLALVEGHPAFRGVALPGFHFEDMLAWGDSPYPQPHREPVVLHPERFRLPDGQVCTKWRPYYVTSLARYEGLLDPAEHWAFVIPPAAPQA